MEGPKNFPPEESPNRGSTTSPEAENKPFVPPWMIPPQLWEQSDIDIDEAIADEDETFKEED
jgi:hypothetical protein